MKRRTLTVLDLFWLVLLAGIGCAESTATNEHKGRKVEYLVLTDKAFQQEYRKAFTPVEIHGEGEKALFANAVRTAQGAVEEALLERWKKVEDFEVGWDFDYCYHVCGGIYSDRIFTKDYVDTIVRTLDSLDKPEKWTYHTACEIIVNPDGATLAEKVEERGEFFIRNGKCYINGSEMQREWRTRLGCQD